MHPSAQSNSYVLLMIEAALTLLIILIAFALPRFASGPFRRIESAFTALARRKSSACITVGLTMLLGRLALLPLFPAPHPFLPDDFSFLLAGDTFAHGRLTNPAPALWQHFESIHVTVQPTYQSMYFPATGLFLAAGKVLFGHPWAGLLIASSLMCAALCWMLQAWLPPTWALLGGFIAVARIGLFSYWTNTYTGGGSVSALGGALVLGALPRLTKTGKARYAILTALGISILAICRPYEGLLICLPTAVALGHWIFRGKNRPAPLVLIRRAAPAVAIIAATLAFLGYYDYRTFGNAKTLPYTIDRATYAVVPYYVWQKAHPTPLYRHADLRQFYTEREARDFHLLHSGLGVIPYYLKKLNTTVFFFAGFLLLPPLIMARRVFLDRRIRFLALCIPFWIVGMGIGVYLIPHYLAPFTAAFYALGLQAMRHLRAARWHQAPVGRTLVRAMVSVCVLLTCVRAFAAPLHIAPQKWPINPWICSWVGPGDFGADRARIVSDLEHHPGNHLVFVRYAPGHESIDEWVYNDADIDHSRIIWAQDMDAASNRDLIRHYNTRDAWLVQPDQSTPAGQGTLTPYTATDSLLAAR